MTTGQNEPARSAVSVAEGCKNIKQLRLPLGSHDAAHEENRESIGILQFRCGGRTCEKRVGIKERVADLYRVEAQRPKLDSIVLAIGERTADERAPMLQLFPPRTAWRCKEASPCNKSGGVML